MFAITCGTQISRTDCMKVEVGVSRGTKGANRKIEGQVSRGTGNRGNMFKIYYLLGRIHLIHMSTLDSNIFPRSINTVVPTTRGSIPGYTTYAQTKCLRNKKEMKLCTSSNQEAKLYNYTDLHNDPSQIKPHTHEKENIQQCLSPIFRSKAACKSSCWARRRSKILTPHHLRSAGFGSPGQTPGFCLRHRSKR